MKSNSSFSGSCFSEELLSVAVIRGSCSQVCLPTPWPEQGDSSLEFPDPSSSPMLSPFGSLVSLLCQLGLYPCPGSSLWSEAWGPTVFPFGLHNDTQHLESCHDSSGNTLEMGPRDLRSPPESRSIVREQPVAGPGTCSQI